MTVVVSSFFIVNVLAINKKIKVNNSNVDAVEVREAYY